MSPRRDTSRRIGSIRISLIIVALLPSVTLAAVWGVTTTRVLAEGWQLRAQTNLSKSTGALGTEVTLALQTERRLSAAWLGSQNPSKTVLDRQRAKTDAMVKKLVKRSDELERAPARIRDRVYPVIAAAESLEYYRGQVDNPTDIHADQALDQYTDIIDAQINAFQELSQVDDGELTSEAGPLVALGHAAELISQEDATLSLAWSRGRLTGEEYADFVQAVSARRWLAKTQIAPFLTGDTKAWVERIVSSDEWKTMVSIEDEIVTAHGTAAEVSGGVALPDLADRWRSALDKLAGDYRDLIRARIAALLDLSSTKARDLLGEAALVSVGGLVAVLLSVLLSWRITRSLARRLRGLREATLQLAEKRLPDVVTRLNRGERIEAEAEAEALDLDYGKDELGQVAQAFNVAQRTAVRSAVELADTRKGFQKVILGVARHTQNLANRQLSLLDTLERKHQDPAVLKGLYELDSTASQMRRYEENLVILSGGQPGRRWNKPVPVVDVLRSAVGEVAEYQRVSVYADNEVQLVAPAVADVIHLLAELIENATVFSPSPAPVQVRANLVVKGLAVEIEDRGVGMTEQDYTVMNRQLAQRPRFDVLALADDSRLGMFVISRLASRHGIRVALRPSPFGGTTAVVLVPDEIIVRGVSEESTDPRFDEVNGDLSHRRPVVELAPRRQTSAESLPRPPSEGWPQAQSGSTESGPGKPSRQRVLVSASGPGDLPGSPNPGPEAALPSRAYPAGNGDPTGPRGRHRQLPPSPSAPGDSAGATIADAPQRDTPQEDTPRLSRPAPPGLAPLPRRVPQTNLVTELRQEPDSPSPADTGTIGIPSAPSAEEAASSLSAFQRGTQHARDQQPDTPPTKDA